MYALRLFSRKRSQLHNVHCGAGWVRHMCIPARIYILHLDVVIDVQVTESRASLQYSPERTDVHAITIFRLQIFINLFIRTHARLGGRSFR